MIDGLIGGKVYGAPVCRQSKNGNSFVTAKLRVGTEHGESLFVNAIAFGESASAALLALRDGDSACLAGEVTPTAWIDKAGEAKPSLDIKVHAILTAYHVKRKRDAVAAKATPERQAGGGDPYDGYGSMDGEGF